MLPELSTPRASCPQIHRHGAMRFVLGRTRRRNPTPNFARVSWCALSLVQSSHGTKVFCRGRVLLESTHRHKSPEARSRPEACGFVWLRHTGALVPAQARASGGSVISAAALPVGEVHRAPAPLSLAFWRPAPLRFSVWTAPGLRAVSPGGWLRSGLVFSREAWDCSKGW